MQTGKTNRSFAFSGATGADDKVIQHNGFGTVTIDGFTVVDFGKLYRSCGNCAEQGERNVVVKNVKAYNGKALVGINSNFGDTATISSSCATSTTDICIVSVFFLFPPSLAMKSSQVSLESNQCMTAKVALTNTCP